MSIATVVTMGFSISGGLSAGTASLPTLGYTSLAVTSSESAFCVRKLGSFVPRPTEFGNFSPGAKTSGEHTPGSVKSGIC